MVKPGSKSIKTLTVAQTTREIHAPVTEAAQALKGQARGQVKIRWNRRTGVPRSIRGVLSEPGMGAPQEIARQFLQGQRELLGLQADLADLQHVQTVERRGIRHVTFRQLYHGLPVFGAELTIHIDQADRVQMVNGEYCPDISLDVSQEPISKNAAIYTVLTQLELDGQPPADARAELVIFVKGGTYYRAYKVTLSTKVPLGSWLYFVDAVSGTILDGCNTMRFVKGKGSAYNDNPKRDGNEVVTVPLFDLKGDRTLSGEYFLVQNDQGPEAVASSAQHEFLYTADNTHFDETMVYYHLSRVAEFFRNLGQTNPPAPMTAHVHVPDPDTGNANYDNAYYDPRENAVYFGHGEEFADLAKESAVIYHEYTHAIIEAAQPLMNTHEAGALHEGYADYFACSITDDPQIGEYILGPLGQPYLRNLRNQKTYQQFTGLDVHIDGEIWGITCWKIREALGSRVADLLLYESLGYLPPNATFADAYEGIAQADTLLFSGEHLTELEEIFIEQKIIPGPTVTYTITATAQAGGKIQPAGTVSVIQGEDQTFTISADAGYGIADVFVDTLSKGKITTYTFVDVSAAHTIDARFAKSETVQRTVIVPGKVPWMNTGMTVAAGDKLQFAAQGTLVYNRRGDSCGPQGTSWTDARDREDPLWNKPHGGLIGKIGDTGSPFFIGASATLTVDRNGVLFLGVNDYWYQGNTGEFTVTVTLSRSA